MVKYAFNDIEIIDPKIYSVSPRIRFDKTEIEAAKKEMEDFSSSGKAAAGSINALQTELEDLTQMYWRKMAGYGMKTIQLKF